LLPQLTKAEAKTFVYSWNEQHRSN